MSFYRELDYQNFVDRVGGLQFSVMSPEDIRRSSVAEITSRDTYINNKPAIGGLFDPRMGVLEPGLICPTDGLDYMQTPGYFGHIELARPVFYIQYFNTILNGSYFFKPIWWNCRYYYGHIRWQSCLSFIQDSCSHTF